VATVITNNLAIPTIGIGAGPNCSGQVLVWDDALGNWTGHKAKFVHRFADLGGTAEKGVEGYVNAVKQREFPREEHTYEMNKGEWEKYENLLKKESINADIYSLPSSTSSP
jgi:3-methyl-2-oxobutanoate hydroxymethyltransferase